MTGDRFCAFNSNIFLCFSFWGVWEIYHTEGIHGNSLQNFYLPKLNPGDQICAYFVISLFCGAPTVFVLLAMPIIAACPARYTSHFTSWGRCLFQPNKRSSDNVVLDKMFWCNGPIIAPGGCIKG